MTEFVEVKTDDLIGPALDWAIAKACGLHVDIDSEFGVMSDEARNVTGKWAPSIDWAQGGPLLDKHAWALPYRAIARHHLGKYEACTPGGFPHNGPTPLIAAMRALVASEFGGTVLVPKELLSC